MNLDEIRKLANVDGPCITICMPLESAPNTSRIDFQRLKSAIRQTEQELQEKWPDLTERMRRDLLDSLPLLEAESDQWSGHGGSLIALRSPEVFRAFDVVHKLDHFSRVGEFFHLFPILHSLHLAEQVFYLLALSQNNVRLLKCTRNTSEVLTLPAGVPTSMEEWLNTRLPNSAPHHGSGHDGEPGSTAGSFTSTTDRDNKDEHISNFFHVINKGVAEVLHGQSHPLVLCGVEYERSMYANINSYPNLVADGVHGSPESLKGGEMHARALEVVQSFFAQPAVKALERWERVAGTAKVTTSFPDIVKAAFEGRVADLFARQDAQTMGVFDRQTMEMTVHGRQEDLVNAAALQTLAMGGEVYIVSPEDVPGGQQVAAILRY